MGSRWAKFVGKVEEAYSQRLLSDFGGPAIYDLSATSKRHRLSGHLRLVGDFLIRLRGDFAPTSQVARVGLSYRYLLLVKLYYSGTSL